MERMLTKRLLPVVLTAVMLTCAAPAQAAFPGANGKLAWGMWEEEPEQESICTATVPGGFVGCGSATFFDRDPAWSSDGTKIAFTSAYDDVYITNADGSGLTQVTNDPGLEKFFPAWSAGGTYLTFTGATPNQPGDVYSVKTDGTGATNLTNHPSSDDAARPGPSGKIAFISDRAGNRDVYVMDADGGSVTQLTTDPAADYAPDWSPDGKRIAFTSNRDGNREIYVMDDDGSDETRITTTPAEHEGKPVWSPDGQQIAFNLPYECLGCVDAGSINRMNADGSGRQTVFAPGGGDTILSGPDWQPLPVSTPSTHVRPSGATPFRVALVPAFNECTTGNRTHGPPLAFPSCTPPVGSPNLTVGVGDGSPALSRSVGFVRIAVWPGIPGGSDDTDARVQLSLTNVMRTSDLSEYTGELRASAQVRLTDRQGAVSQTTSFPLEWDVPCVPTASTLDKSTCALSTTLDSITPGAAAEGTRAVWGLDRVRVYDGGPDEDAETTADNSLLATQGVFVP